MARLLPALLLTALALGGCGGDDENDNPRRLGGIERATVTEIITGDPRIGRDVRVRGTAYPVGEAGLVLEDDGAAVFVELPPTEAQKIDARERVWVTGNVRVLDDTAAFQLATQVTEAGAVRSATSVDRAALRRAPVDRGAPYVDGRSISGEGGG